MSTASSVDRSSSFPTPEALLAGSLPIVPPVLGVPIIAPLGSATPALRLASWERLDGWAFEHGSIRGEAGAVAGAVPGMFGGVEAQQASEVGASE